MGFSDKVTLGELGEIIESRSEVMRVQFSDYLTGKPYPMHGEIYLRGAVLTSYERGQWSLGQLSLGYGPEELRPVTRLPREGVVRQKIAIQGLDRNELFYVAPLIPVEYNADVIMDRVRQRLTRSEDVCTRPMDYELATTALSQGHQSPLLPVDQFDFLDSALQMPGGLVPAATRAALGRLPVRVRPGAVYLGAGMPAPTVSPGMRVIPGPNAGMRVIPGPNAGVPGIFVPPGAIVAPAATPGGLRIGEGAQVTGRPTAPAPRPPSPAPRTVQRRAASAKSINCGPAWQGLWSAWLEAKPQTVQRLVSVRDSLPNLVALGDRWISRVGPAARGSARAGPLPGAAVRRHPVSSSIASWGSRAI